MELQGCICQENGCNKELKEPSGILKSHSATKLTYDKITTRTDIWIQFISIQCLGENGTCTGKPCGESCIADWDYPTSGNRPGICNGKGVCVDPLMNPCSVHGCEGKSCGDDCLSGDIMGWCDANGNCDFQNHDPDCGGMSL